MTNKEIKRQNVITEIKKELFDKYLKGGFGIEESYMMMAKDLNRIFNKKEENYEKNFNKT